MPAVRRPRSLLAAVLALVGAASFGRGQAPAHAGDPSPSVRTEVERCLAEVASDDFAVREAARQRLAALARRPKDLAEVRAALEARRDDPDAEVRRTVRSLLDGLGGQVPPGGTADLAALGRVEFADSGPLAEVLDRFGARWGGRFRLPTFAVALPTKVEAKGPYFAVLAAILAPHRLELAQGFDEGGQGAPSTVPDTGGGVLPPAACVGPFRLEVDSVSATRSLRTAAAMKYAIGLRLQWAPGTQVISYGSPEVVRAVDRRGRAFASPSGQPNVTWGIGVSRKIADLSLTLEPETPESGPDVESLEVRIRLRVRHGWRDVAFDDLAALPATGTVPLDGGNASREKDRPGERAAPGTVTLESFGPDPERAGLFRGAVTAVLPKGIAADAVFATLEVSDGTIRPLYDMSTRIQGSDGTLRMTVRALGLSSAAAPKAVRVGWMTAEDEAPVTFTLANVPLR